ncbi:MAG TPA: hypothetical protein DCX25_03170 [Candidatus Pacebacteria bacterium]|nr:MAG: hypothetical protein UX00_C0007G0155 [Microgenomates group bacterium GW2011_GWB1_45_17]KKU23651.1 MAG: hypothetical protein UX35_C0004G0007 [Microgenomates group bacterium GW2011_GWA1_46_15]KKU24552.1 MAG: hypothetical protein UX36_C0001G0169 [Microgenomates group bacterium GW2011_GWC1_46_15]HAV15305.1 hypothetical protein [Candidatus Paceibacterota bacterium]HCR11022.1 hypothetical protein [Candidatus Paceibacterota bacterium]
MDVQENIGDILRKVWSGYNVQEWARANLEREGKITYYTIDVPVKDLETIRKKARELRVELGTPQTMGNGKYRILVDI